MCEAWLACLGGLSCQFPQIGLLHRHAFAIARKDENFSGRSDLWRTRRTLLLIKVVEVRGGARDELFDLSFRDVRARVRLERSDNFVKGLRS